MADLQKIVDTLSGLTVLEAAELAKLLDDARPDFRRLQHVASGSEAFEIEIALVLLGRMTAEAILLECWLNLAGELIFQFRMARSHRRMECNSHQAGRQSPR